MTTIEHLEATLLDLSKEVEEILAQTSLSLTQKDPMILLCTQKKRVLTQALQDIAYLEENHPQEQAGCGMNRFREES